MQRKWLTVLAAASALTSWGLVATLAQAKADTYQITATKKLANVPYHVTNAKQTLYSWNRNHTQRLVILNRVSDLNWFAAQKVTMTHAGKAATYYHIYDFMHHDYGYVYAQAMTQGYTANYSSEDSRYGFLRLNAATPVQGRNRTYTLPAGTVASVSFEVHQGQPLAFVKTAALSYQLRQTLGVNSQDSTLRINLNQANTTEIAQPSYSLLATDKNGYEQWGNVQYPGTGITGPQKQLFQTTSDGYVEYYDNGQVQNTAGAPHGKPNSQKILSSTTVNGITTIGYREHLAGVHDTPATVAGAPGYQLTLQRLNTTLAGTGNDSGYFYAQYRIGGQPFFDQTNQDLTGKSTFKPRARLVTGKALARAEKDSQNNNSRYYQTTKQLRLKVSFSAKKLGSREIVTTVPKGTILAVSRVSQETSRRGKTSWVYQVNPAALSANILKPGYQKGLWVTGTDTELRNPQGLKRVKRPAALPKYGDGSLTRGGATALTQYRSPSIQITSNGYLEVDPQNSSTTTSGRPAFSVKIQRTTIQKHTRYLYLAKPLKDFQTTKISYRGKAQYRLALVNPQKLYAIDSNPDDDPDTTFYSILKLGGQSVFTFNGHEPE